MCDSNLKILYLIDHLETNYPRDQNYIIRYMMEKGHDITVITCKDKGRKFEIYDRVIFPNVSFIRATSIGQLKRATFYLHPYLFRDLFRKFDVVHAFTFFTTSSVLGALAKAEVRVLRSEIGPPYGMTFVKAQQKLSIYSSLIEIYKSLYDYITAYNFIEVKSLLTLGFDRQKIVVISPMIDYNRFSNLRRTNVYGDAMVIGCIARISPEKGVHRLIPLVKTLLRESQSIIKRFRLMLAGRIDDPIYGHKIISSLRVLLGERFSYLGEIAPPYRFYEVVDIVIVPSIMETGAISVLEAMAAEKIVIASNIYPINLYIRHGINGFLFTEIPEVVKVIKYLLEEQGEGARYLRKNAQATAKGYDYRVVCSKLERVYKSCE